MPHTQAPLAKLRHYFHISMRPDSSAAKPRREDPRPGTGRAGRAGDDPLGRSDPLSMGDVLAERAAELPTRVALDYLDDSGAHTAWTYGELHQRALAVAERLSGRVAPGERAVLLYGPGLDFVSAFFGCLYAGVLPVPTTYPRPRKPMPRLDGIVKDCSPAALLSTRATLDETELGSAASLATIATDDCVEPSGDFLRCLPERTDLAFLQYTSGSTSDPRGVMVSHRNLLTNLEAIREGFGLSVASATDEPQRGVFWLPAFHDMGLIGAILTPIYVGATSHLMSPATFLRRPMVWLEEIARVRAHISGAPNFAYRLCAEKAAGVAVGELDLSSWRLAFCGAEPIDAAVLDGFAEAFQPHGFSDEAFYPCYGLAETTLLAAGGRGPAKPHVLRAERRALESNRCEVLQNGAADGRRIVACGGALEGHELVIADPATRTPLPTKAIGEVWVRGGSVARGYWGHEETNTDTFAATLDGDTRTFLRTGDLGFLEDDRLYVVGRLKDVVIVRGRNHYPQDIEETAVSAHEAVDTGAVFSVEHEEGGTLNEELVAVHQIDRKFRKEDLSAVAQQVRSAIAERHEVEPLAVVLIQPASLPTTSSGKVQRSKCREMYLAGELKVLAEWRRPAEGAGEQSAVERPDFSAQIAAGDRAALAAAILDWMVRWLPAKAGIPDLEVTPTMPLTELGIDSFTAIELGLELDDITGLPLPPMVTWSHPTPAELCDFLAGEMLASKQG